MESLNNEARDDEILVPRDEVQLAVKNIPLLLSGVINEFTVQTDNRGPITYGRLEMRTFADEPIYYFHMIWSNRGTFVPPEFLQECLQSMRDELGAHADASVH